MWIVDLLLVVPELHPGRDRHTAHSGSPATVFWLIVLLLGRSAG